MSAASDLFAIVKAYDVRGIVGDQFTPAMARALGGAFARFVGPAAGAVVVAHDMRDSSPELAGAFAEGVTAAGLDVVNAGLGVHRPAVLRLRARWTCRARCSPPRTTRPRTTASSSAGPAPCRSAWRPGWPRSATTPWRSWTVRRPPVARPPGTVTSASCSPTTPSTCAALVDLSGIRPLHVVVDAGNGMAGYTVAGGVRRPAARDRSAVLRTGRHLPQPRGQPARPEEPGRPAGRGPPGRRRHRAGLRRRRRPLLRDRRDAASRCRPARSPRWSPPASWPGHPARPILLQPDHLARGAGDRRARHGGIPVRTRVGHSFIKAEMARTGAVFGGEHSAHYYFARLLPRRHRHAGRDARARRPRRPGRGPLSELVAALPALRRVRRDQLHGPRRAARPGADPGVGGGTTRPSTSSTA